MKDRLLQRLLRERALYALPLFPFDLLHELQHRTGIAALRSKGEIAPRTDRAIGVQLQITIQTICEILPITA